MASIAFVSRTGHSDLLIQRIASALLTLPNMVRRWASKRQTHQELYRLSDRQLDDIGIARGDINALSVGFVKTF